MPQHAAKRIIAGFKVLADENGDRRTLDIRKLKNRDGYRLRVGKFRAIFIETDEKIVVLDAGSRGDIY